VTTPQQQARALVVPAVLVAAASGAIIAFQGRLNGDLSVAGAGVLVASWLSYVGTLATVVVVVVLQGHARQTAGVLRTRGRWWWYAIGLCGIPIVLAFSYGVPLVGVAVASVCSVAGQTVSGLVLDARGVGVPATLPLTGRRALAALTAIAGLGLAVAAGSGNQDVSPAQAVWIGVLLFVAGATLAGQNAGNGKVTQLSGDPVTAALTSATGGTVAITAILGIAAAAGALSGVSLPDEPGQWYLYLGGPLGAAITVGAAWSVRRLGTFALTLAIVGGQMIAAVFVDLARGVGVHWATPAAVLAIALATALGVTTRRRAA